MQFLVSLLQFGHLLKHTAEVSTRVIKPRKCHKSIFVLEFDIVDWVWGRHNLQGAACCLQPLRGTFMVQ